MLDLAVAACALAGVGGVLLAAYIFRADLAPWALSAAHGSLGLTVVVLTAISAFRRTGGPMINGALFMLVITAIGGLSLASLHWRGETARSALVLWHAVFAVIGFGLLVAAALAD
jgi:hypothetical protein